MCMGNVSTFPVQCCHLLQSHPVVGKMKRNVWNMIRVSRGRIHHHDKQGEFTLLLPRRRNVFFSSSFLMKCHVLFYLFSFSGNESSRKGYFLILPHHPCWKKKIKIQPLCLPTVGCRRVSVVAYWDLDKPRDCTIHWHTFRSFLHTRYRGEHWHNTKFRTAMTVVSGPVHYCCDSQHPHCCCCCSYHPRGRDNTVDHRVNRVRKKRTHPRHNRNPFGSASNRARVRRHIFQKYSVRWRRPCLDSHRVLPRQHPCIH